MGSAGIETVRLVLPDLRREKQADLVIAQAENVTEGKGLSVADYDELRSIGVDFFTGGNWSLFRPEIIPYLEDSNQPVTRPANYPAGTPGRGWKYIKTAHGDVLVISLLGQIIGKDSGKPCDNPLKVIDQILAENSGRQRAATVVNFHGDYSSEKKVIGYYLDGRVSAVIGDHWHIPTADAMVLPKGTAHQTDVGMCGALHSSLGVKLDAIIPRWRDNIKNKNTLESEGSLQFNAALIEVTPQIGLAKAIDQIQRIIN
jgi:2',3'-cyclic-nucleotide 2'-phosphodiesterase